MKRRTLRLFMVVGQAAFLFTVAYFVVTIVLLKVFAPPGARFGPPPRELSIVEVIALVASLVVPAALGFWWILRKLRAECPRRKALDAAIAFAVVSPVALIPGLVFVGPFVGGYTDILLGTESGVVVLSSVVLGIVVTIALMTFIPVFVITRPTVGESRWEPLWHARRRWAQEELREPPGSETSGTRD